MSKQKAKSGSGKKKKSAPSAPTQASKKESAMKTAAATVAVEPETTEIPSNTLFPEGIEDRMMDVGDVQEEQNKILAHLAKLEAEMQMYKQYSNRLQKRYNFLSSTVLQQFGLVPVEKKTDGRKVYNPEKNLKISLRAAYRWAKQAGKTADAARQSVIAATISSAKENYASDPAIAPYIQKNSLPPSVMEQIDYWHKNYDKIKKAKIGEEAATDAMASVS